MKKLDNKGAAIISVMVAILFIGLLATSLMYMAYNNYITKSMRRSSTSNFYYDEFALDDLTCEMQQYCSNQGTIDNAITALGGICGSGDTGSGNTFTGTYVPAQLTPFISIANSNSTDVLVTLSASTLPGRTEPIYERTAYTITFKNLCITTLDKRRDFTTSITVDFSISIKNNDQGSMKVNDFSLMSDNPIEWNRGGNLVYGGNVFCMNKSDIVHGVAFSVNNGSACTFSGDRTLIVGDMKIQGNSVVCMSGQVTVTGDIYVESGSMLFCTTNLVIGGTIHGTAVYGNKTFDATECATITQNCQNLFGTGGDYANGLASLILDDVKVIYKIDDTTFGTVDYNAANAPSGYTQNSMGTLAYYTNNNDRIQTATSPMTTGTRIYVRNGSNNENSTPNTLLFFTKQDQQLRQASPNTTIIAPAGCTMGSSDSTVGPMLTHMTDEDYNACLNTMIDVNLPLDIATHNGQNVGGSGGTIANFNSIISSHSAAVASGDTVFDDGYVIIPYPSLSGTMKYAVYNKNDNQMYIPWKYFIRDDADRLITGAFNGIVGEDNSMYSSISYTNWVKQ